MAIGPAIIAQKMSAQSDSDWHAHGGHRYRLLSVDSSPAPKAGLINMQPEQTGIQFTNLLSVTRYMTNQTLLNGSGVAADDIDGDGLCDLYFNSLDNPNRLFRNKGNWQFENITDQAGVACPDADSTACVLSDLDGDGRPELLVNTMYRGLRLFRNRGDGTFEERTLEAGMQPALGGMTVTVADYDLDGKPDIYVSRYRASALMDVPNAYVDIKKVGGKRIVSKFNGRPTAEPDLQHRFYIDERGGIGEYGEPDTLYRNLGNLTFEPVDWTGGTFLDELGNPLSEIPRDWGLAAMFRDLNHDGYPDLYVCNDFDTPDRIWINTRKGTFKALPSHAIRQTSWFAMGLDVADVDRDGDDDILVLDMLARSHQTRLNQLGDVKPAMHLIRETSHRPQFMKTTLQMNRGDMTYAEVGQWAGVAASDWAWGVAFLDVDLDGYEDLLITNGHERDGRNIDVANQLKAMRRAKKMSDREIFEKRMLFPTFDTPNMALRNQGNGTFEDISESWGFDLDDVSHGICLADLDGDGDLDVAVNNLNAQASIYQNHTSAPRIAVRAHDIGTRLELSDGAFTQSQEIIAGGKYLSDDQSIRTFAWPYKKNANVTLTIHWPGGQKETIRDILPNRFFEIKRQTTENSNPATDDAAKSTTLFVDESHLLNHQHNDPDFDDWARQPLIDASLAYEGPAVAWLDLNHDGWEDLILSNGRGGKPNAFLNQKGQSFEPITKPPFHLPASRDQVSLVGWRDEGGNVRLLAGSSNYEDGLPLGSPIREYRLRDGKTLDAFPGRPDSIGPMALGDVDRDGDLDLFVGSRVLPGKFPTPPDSHLFLNEEGSFVMDKERSKLFQHLGMVRSACWFDEDRDGFPELLVTRDWNSLAFFKNNQGLLVDETSKRGLAHLKGWWSGLAPGDFNNDGQIDFIAGNRGMNGPHQEHLHHPVRLYHGDFDQNQTHDIIRAHFEPTLNDDAPDQQLGMLARGIPTLVSHYRSYQAFSQQTVSKVLTSLKAKADMLEVNTSQTMVFINNQGKFEAHPLPSEAQWAPVFGVASGDFDGDGHLDIFLAQNNFQLDAMTPRMDAGLGLVCLGTGSGTFTPLSPHDSGIRILGEQRGSAVSDWNGDGRLDLVVGQNRGSTVLLTNREAIPGIRTQLIGSPANPGAIGAQIRGIQTNGHHGPWLCVTAGSSYGSQMGMIQVIGPASQIDQLEVCWPDGSISRHKVSDPDILQIIRMP